MRLVAVWGSGTGVGKTLLSSGLLAACRLSPSLFVKPVQTGVPDSDGETVARLAGAHHEPAAHAVHAGLRPTHGGRAGARATTLFAWNAAVSPHVAAAREGRAVDDAQVVRATRAELANFAHDCTADADALIVVETAGGVASPSPSGSLQCDVYAPLALPAILVGDARLGGISATLCAAEALRARGHQLAGVVLFEEPGAARELGNADALREHLRAAGGVPVFQVEAPPPMPEPLDGWLARALPAFDTILEAIPSTPTHYAAQPLVGVSSVEGACPFLAARQGPGAAATVTPSAEALLADDMRLLWHPYTSTTQPTPCVPVSSASGVTLTLADGRRLVDGMSSWWAAIHGYGVPEIDTAAARQLGRMGHVMFGGITHESAVGLGHRLVDMTPAGLERVFLADSGSVSVEVAIKMALQYWRAQGAPAGTRGRLLTVRGGYHGDTFGAMSVCDPINGMHAKLFESVLPKHLFAPLPSPRFGEACEPADLAELQSMMRAHREDIAAVILEPIVQGAGGMHFYSADYLREVRRLCDETGALLILDEIATGFGRTGELFACEHAGIVPDIMCVGKALTGGYMTLGATLATRAVADGASGGPAAASPVPLMHGPTFMANPLACAVASASLDLVARGTWRDRVGAINAQLAAELEPCRASPAVADVRTLGAIGVVEMREAVDVPHAQALLARHGVWLRPFGKLLYTMPPYVMGEADLRKVTTGMRAVVEAVS